MSIFKLKKRDIRSTANNLKEFVNLKCMILQTIGQINICMRTSRNNWLPKMTTI